VATTALMSRSDVFPTAPSAASQHLLRRPARPARAMAARGLASQHLLPSPARPARAMAARGALVTVCCAVYPTVRGRVRAHGA
jgi:hypothetical protein